MVVKLNWPFAGKLHWFLVAFVAATGIYSVFLFSDFKSAHTIFKQCEPAPEYTPPTVHYSPSSSESPNSSEWTFDVNRDDRNLGLDDAQCDAAFPKLYQELDRAKAWHQAHRRGGKISETDIDQYDGRAQMRLMIYDGQLRILDRWGIEGPHIPDRPLATMEAIHRAIVALPDPRVIPNIEFTIDTQDDALDGGPKNTIWAYCRHSTVNSTWVMPDFGFWSYPNPTVGSYNEFRTKVKGSEEAKGFQEKKAKLIWRGQEGNGGDVRRALIDASKGKKWSDVAWLDWGDMTTPVDMHEHCRYQYAAHTEGVTWSGRLRYLQSCNSVVVTHKLDYIAHYYPLLVSSGEDQNIVETERDYSDLNDKMNELIQDPIKAERIASNGAKLFRDRYLTPAAEACYWRRMFRTWREVQGFEPRILADVKKGDEAGQYWRGISWEEYSVTGTNWGQDAPP